MDMQNLQNNNYLLRNVILLWSLLVTGEIEDLTLLTIITLLNQIKYMMIKQDKMIAFYLTL